VPKRRPYRNRGGTTQSGLLRDRSRLADHSVDVILALDSYRHYDYPEKMLAAFAQALRGGGRWTSPT
jgi:hypothetical protein